MKRLYAPLYEPQKDEPKENEDYEAWIKTKKGLIKIPPLPYTGAKTRWLDEIGKIIYRRPAKTYVDLFGGSGIISRFIKDLYPEANVVYNNLGLDYIQRLDRIGLTNAILLKLEDCAAQGGILEWERNHYSIYGKSHKKNAPKGPTRYPASIEKSLKEAIVELYNQDAGLDIATIASRVTFSGKPTRTLEDLLSQGFYRRGVLNIHYSEQKAAEYTRGLTIRNEDYADLIDEYRGSDCIFIADPPYPKGSSRAYIKEDRIPVDTIIGQLRGSRSIIFSNLISAVPPGYYVIKRAKKLGANEYKEMKSSEYLITNI